jgi:hypothetical protein
MASWAIQVFQRPNQSSAPKSQIPTPKPSVLMHYVQSHKPCKSPDLTSRLLVLIQDGQSVLEMSSKLYLDQSSS